MARTAPCCTSATNWVGTACWRAKRSGVCKLVPGCGLSARRSSSHFHSFQVQGDR